MRKLLFGLLGIFGLFVVPAHAALPTGYTELEYIESTGTQYINTGVGLYAANKITGKISFVTLNALSYIAGGRLSDNKAIGYALYGESHSGFTIYNTSWPEQGVNVSADQILEFETVMKSGQQSFTVNGNRILTGEKNISFDSNTISLFGLRTEYMATAKIYYLKIWNNDTLVRDFVPAKNASGVIGMYDIVTNTFYTNAGSGSFVAGPIACEGERVAYTSATGTVVQNGTPTPTNPIDPVFYTQGDMVLRKVGDYADTYDATTGKITRRVGVKVFDGTEDWIRTAQYTNLYEISLKNDGALSGSIMFALTSTHLIGTVEPNADMPDNSIKLTTRSTDRTDPLIFIKTSQGNDTLAGFKQWLAEQYANGTPVTIYYPLATAVEEDWPSSYCETPIKVATTKYTETVFNPLNTALAAAVATVNTVVTNTINQAASIATLQSGKQTRPADNTECPAYKQCLLVEDENGTPHWYQITDPFRDFVAPIIANNVNAASSTSTQGFTQLEYIESTGTQYIDTGVTSNEVSRITVNTRWRMNNFSGNTYVFGSLNRNASVIKDSAFGDLISYIDGKYYSNNYSFTASIAQLPRQEVSFNTDYEYELKYENQRSSVKINDSTMSFLNDNAIKSIPSSIYICKGNDDALTDGFDGRVYYLKIELNGALVRNFIPAQRNSDNAIGMYDTVSNTFFTNAGTGTFIAGPTVANTDVPTNPTWSATWAADATTGVTAGTVYGEGVCNAVTGTASTAATSAQTSSANWSVDGANCWCRVTSVDDGNESSKVDGVWIFDGTYSSAANCANNCANNCAYNVRSYESFRSAMFGM